MSNTENTIFYKNSKYKIKECIYSGKFSKIYKIEKNGDDFILKESVEKEQLQNEANIYYIFKNISNISKLYNYFSFSNTYYLVLDYYEIDIKLYKNEFFYTNNYNNNIINIISNTLKIIKDIHNLGYIHRDLKPENICVKNNQPYLIDFGMVKKIIYNKKHIIEKKINNIIGTYNFISINVINLIEPSRRDDIESILYVFIYCLVDNDKYNIDEIRGSNEYFSKYITKNIDSCFYNFFIKSYNYIKLLKFAQAPNYAHINNLLDEIDLA